MNENCAVAIRKLLAALAFHYKISAQFYKPSNLGRNQVEKDINVAITLFKRDLLSASASEFKPS
jgi:hypothetical protein